MQAWQAYVEPVTVHPEVYAPVHPEAPQKQDAAQQREDHLEEDHPVPVEEAFQPLEDRLQEDLPLGDHLEEEHQDSHP